MTSNPTYFLKSPRLGFRAWSMDDVPLALTLWGNPEVTRTFGGPFSEAQIHERLAREIANQLAYKLQYWPVFLLDSDEFAGCCGLRPYKQGKQIFELGFHFCPQFWGKGLATESAQTVITYAFGPLGAKGQQVQMRPELHVQVEQPRPAIVAGQRSGVLQGIVRGLDAALLGGLAR